MKTLKDNNLVIISGPSGSGKHSLISSVIEKCPDKFALSMSATTRKKRDVLKDDNNYVFLSNDEFEEYIKKDKFLEYEEYCGNLYGTLKDSVNRSDEKVVILEIDIEGAKQVMKRVPNVVSIFIQPAEGDMDSQIAVLGERLNWRDTENKESTDKRISTAKKELEQKGLYTKVITNDILEKAEKEFLNYLNEIFY